MKHSARCLLNTTGAMNSQAPTFTRVAKDSEEIADAVSPLEGDAAGDGRCSLGL